jgi:hypothetical protein
MNVPEILLDLHIENHHHRCRQQNYVEDKKTFRHNFDVKNVHRTACDNHTPVHQHQFGCVVVTQYFGYEEDDEEKNHHLYDMQGVDVREEARYAFHKPSKIISARQKVHYHNLLLSAPLRALCKLNTYNILYKVPQEKESVLPNFLLCVLSITEKQTRRHRL